MIVGTQTERSPGEHRVAITPASCRKLVKRGHAVFVERGAGERSGYSDEEYVAAGAETVDRDAVRSRSELIVQVRSLAAERDADAQSLDASTVLVAQTDPLADAAATARLASSGATVFSLELVPRITRAQSMDVLSSMASLAGYKAVILAAAALPKQFPMAMTAAGTIKPARVFVVGAGVAGLQAIATARRLGAVVSAYDVRPVVKEQVESLGGRFVEMDTQSGVPAEGTGGYAREMDDAFYERQRAMMLDVLRETDVVITTAAVPGKAAPTLVTAEMVRAMPRGSVICDLAAERGGNCELTRPGQTVTEHGVTILGPTDLPSSLAGNASDLFASNVVAFLGELTGPDGELVIDRDNEVVAGSLVMQGGEAVHPMVRDLAGLEPLPKPKPTDDPTAAADAPPRTIKLVGDD